MCKIPVPTGGYGDTCVGALDRMAFMCLTSGANSIYAVFHQQGIESMQDAEGAIRVSHDEIKRSVRSLIKDTCEYDNN